MKTSVIIFFLILISSCSNDDANKSKKFSLPPETQTGANTFGVTINNKVYIPRDPTGVTIGSPAKGLIFWGAPDNVSWNEIEVKDGASSVGFNIIIHLQNFNAVGVGQYILKQSNFHNQIDSTPNNHIFFKIWDNEIGNYAYYGSIEDQGEINVLRNSNGIVSGNFNGKFVRYDDPNDLITISDGRFDINSFTLNSHPFP